MDVFGGIISGFQTVLNPTNLLFCFAGVFIGTLVGVLPGIGPVGAMSILLPTTYGLSPVSSIIMLSGIFYGAMYGGSTTSILVNIPGEAASVVTCLDGYQMARKGRAGPALGISALGSFIGGTISIFGLVFLVFPLAQIALKLGPPEYFSIIFMSMIILTYMAAGSFAKAIIMVLFGLILGTVGIDSVSGVARFAFGSTSLLDGIGLIPIAMGLFGISEVLTNLETEIKRSIFDTRLKHLLPSLQDWKRSIGPIIRGSFIGFFLGILPGPSPVVSSFLSYSVEKKISKDPDEFGQGAIEGVAGPETANNAATGGSFVPLLALGIPPNVSMGILLGALMIHNVVPGPLLITQHPEVFWGLISSMYLGNIMLVLLNLPLIGIWVKILKIPYRLLMPLILLCCLIGAYSINSNVADIVVMIIFGVIGYILRKFDYEMAPLILAYVLGPMLEKHFRTALTMSDGDLTVFVTRPISGVTLAISFMLLISTGFSYYRKMKAQVIKEEEDK
jgi:putative tricarboxylic transport membrane protein